MSESILPLTPSGIAPTAAVGVEEAPRVYLRPSLNRDLAGIMTLLFIVIIYHIQHPTLLFRVQFGRAFRDDNLQEGVFVALILSIFFLVGAWLKLWAGRKDAIGQLEIALVVGLSLYVIHSYLLIFRDYNVFFDLYGVSASAVEDVFREEALVNPVKALNTSAVFGGAALATVIFLWSPWKYVTSSQQPPPYVSLLQSGSALLTIVMVVITYHIQNPLLLERSRIGEQFSGDSSQLVVGLLLLVAALGLLSTYPRTGHLIPIMARLTRNLWLAMMIVLGLYALHVLAVIVLDFNVFLEYYGVSPETYSQVLGDPSLNTSILALDRAALLGGVAVASAVYLWSPWARFKLYQDAVRSNIVPVIVAIVVVIFWQWAITYFEVKQFLLPRPSVIWDTFKEEYPKLVAAGWFTFMNAAQGFVVGCGAGILTGIASARFSKFSAAILPLAIAANAVPIIAFAPIMNTWFGVTSPNSKIAIVAVLCYFPAMISTLRGLTSVNQTQLELMRTYAASEIDIFRWLRLPNALPFMFSALKLATTLAMIAAIVSEFFGGSLSGLGYRIREDAALFRFPECWAAIVVASLFGISFYMLISALERSAMPWYQSFRSDASG